jgi:hypothetical protein
MLIVAFLSVLSPLIPRCYSAVPPLISRCYFRCYFLAQIRKDHVIAMGWRWSLKRGYGCWNLFGTAGRRGERPPNWRPLPRTDADILNLT